VRRSPSYLTFPQRTVTGRGGAGNAESASSKQRLEAARLFLQQEKEVLAQHKEEMRRHEKQAVGRGGAGNLRRKKNTTVPKESGSSGSPFGLGLFKATSRSSHSSSERSVMDIANTGELTLKLSFSLRSLTHDS
jgi:Protein of unknown function (DUF3602)